MKVAEDRVDGGDQSERLGADVMMISGLAHSHSLTHSLTERQARRRR